ncbi:hypothetical protein RHSIM_Rhsim05G0037200 [Rhododendron simsii]|uniref:Uncharacterized protein n=1 Tax=Rhododendron simsii TaxID=118357 RepID=A0A834LLB4_RHOSS|nr:hypothetical protein RHSIM_Rhsim05G0037200 [Rhododendron simsii]
MATSGLTEMQNEMVGLELNEFFLNFVEGPNGWNTEIDSIAEMSSDWDVFDALEEESTPCQHPMPTIPDMMPHLSCSEPALFQQPMPTVPRTTGSLDDLRNLLPSPEESFLAGDAFGSINRTVPSCSYPVSSQTMSTVPHTTGSSDDLRNLLALEKEPLWAGHVSESINLPAPSCFDPAPSQSMPTILHTMPTNPLMMSLLTERQDTMGFFLSSSDAGIICVGHHC